MESWEKAEKHRSDVRLAIHNTCFVRKTGVVSKYNGKALFNLLLWLGHDKIDIQTCKCGASEYFEKG